MLFMAGIWIQVSIRSGCVVVFAFLQRCMECRRGLAMRILSVCPSVKCLHRDRTEEKLLQICYTIRTIIYPSFLRKGMVGGGDPLSEILGQLTPVVQSEISDFEPIIARNASAVTPSEKVQVTLIGSPLHAFH